MSESVVLAAIETTLKTWAAAQSPALEVAWPNVDFTAPVASYLRAFPLPAETVSLDLGRVNRTFTGVYQVSVYTMLGAGPQPARTIVEGLRTLFDPATPITGSGGVKVWFLQPLSAAPAREERDRLHVPCSVLYRASLY